MPRAARLYAPGGTVHGAARCNKQESCFTTPEDFELLLALLREMIRTSDVTLYAYTLMSNHIHLLLQAPKPDDFPVARSTSASSRCRSIPG
jgi:putative transposase